MATNNTLQISRSNTTAIPTTLANGQLAYTSNGDILYIQSPGTAVGIIPIGGRMYPGTLTANLSLVANSTSGINHIIAANVDILSYLTVNGAVGTAGWVLYSGGAAANAYWAALGAGTPGGATTDVQFNDGGVMNGLAGFTYTKASNTVFVGNTLTVGANVSLNTTVMFIGSNTVVNSVINTVANVIINTSSIAIGYLYVNTALADSTTNQTSNAVLTANSLVIGNSSVNSTFQANQISIGANLFVNTSTILINSNTVTNTSVNTVTNTVLTSTGLNISYFFGNSAIISTGTVDVTSNVWANASTLIIGNSTVNSTVNSTLFTGTANNATNLGGVAAASYVQNTDSRTLSGNLIIAGTNTVISSNLTTSGANVNIGGTNTNITSNVTITGANIQATTATLTVLNAIVTGNLTIAGTVETINTAELIVNANMVELGSHNITTDITDTGWFSPAGNSTLTWYTVFGRIAAKSTNNNPWFYAFVTNTNPNTAVTFDIGTNATQGTLQSWLAPYGNAAGGAFVVNSTTISLSTNSTVTVVFSNTTIDGGTF